MTISELTSLMEHLPPDYDVVIKFIYSKLPALSFIGVTIDERKEELHLLISQSQDEA